MSTPDLRFPYVLRDQSLGNAGLAPMLPLTLIGSQSIAVHGLLDSGATINLAPFTVGTRLGFDWGQESRSIRLSGNLASVEARVLLLSAIVGPYPLIRFACAWAQTDDVPIILGQVNFFMEFDVCFFRSQGEFQIRPRS